MTVADAKDSVHLSSQAVQPSSLPLPVVSLSGEPQEIARTIRQAGTEHGFFYGNDCRWLLGWSCTKSHRSRCACSL